MAADSHSAPPAEPVPGGRGGVVLERPRLQYRWEFWVVCAVAVMVPESLLRGLRPVDLVLLASLALGVRMTLKKRLPPPVAWTLLLYFVTLGLRVLVELDVTGNRRTLFGMTAVFLAPVVFFVTRELRISRRAIMWMIGTGVVLALASQMGVLAAQEAYISGMVDLSRYLGIERPSVYWLDLVRFPDTTITVWRALAVGLTLAAIIARTSLGVKGLGVLCLLFQFGGGGGGRSAFLFVAASPVVLLALLGAPQRSRRLTRLLWAGALGLSFAALYFGAPGATTLDTKELTTHQERILELFSPSSFAVDDPFGGFSGRISTWMDFWAGATSSPQAFLFGAGISRGEAYGESALGQAHNIFLDTWGLSGLVGLVFLVIFLTIVFRDFRRLLRSAPNRGQDQLVALTLAGAVLFMAQWLLFQATTSDRPFMVVFYLLSGMLAPAARMIEDGRARRASIGSPIATAVGP